ncbi:unnamed protein product [Hyaloperonospora brassicae]|uniref:TFIIS central domain-containing protein n=1 Tax=Hyaloperonospora brassicae TaxID=162125 RepID=A0AAV0UVU0_HYABA|nr:unnamed protein product [Hyaloperonospora brassicae]
MSACAAVTNAEEEDSDVDAWAVELEAALDCGRDDTCRLVGDGSAHRSDAIGPMEVTKEVGVEEEEEEEKKEAEGGEMVDKAAAVEASGWSAAATLPHEVLALILSFGQVGRVCKSWSLASIAVARRRFSSRLTDILRPLDSKAVILALDVEEELYAAYGQSHSLTKAYAHKARTLLFNLKDARNVDLRNRLVSGDLPTHNLVRMSGPDMANPQLVRQRKEWIKKRTHEVMRDGREVEGFESDLFECRNCGSSRTRYRQWRRKAVVDRTRIIIICLRCPYRWEL